MKISGSKLIAEVLLAHGVDTVFGYPGGAALNIYDELYRYQVIMVKKFLADIGEAPQ